MGGNVFKGKSQGIKIENIESTVEKYFAELKKVFPKKRIFNKKYFHYLGSVGKKPVSGDIDFGIDSVDIVKDFSDNELKKWNLEPEAIKADFTKMKKRARTATDAEIMMKAILKGIAVYINARAETLYTDEKKIGPGTMFGLFPQYSEDGKKLDYGVQIDWMVSDIDLLKFSYYSQTYKGNVKGLHRTQLILSMFQNIDLSFSHAKGLSDKKTGKLLTTKPKEMIEILSKEYNTKFTKNNTDDYFKLIKELRKLPKKEYSNIIDIYFKILDRTRADIPENLQQEWKDKKSVLGLTGKFLPQDSKLLEAEDSNPSFKTYLSESKPTRQLKNLKKDELIAFLKDFIHRIDSLDVTEKLAGQQLTARYNAEENQTYVRPKALKTFFRFEEYNYHRDVMDVLDVFFQKSGYDQELSFEIISDKAHDFINYDFHGKIAVDFSGRLNDRDKKYLNSQDRDIKFLTKQDIIIRHKKGIHHIEDIFRKKWESQIANTRTLKELRSLILPEIQDALGNYIADEFSSVIGKSSAVEGFFMTVNGQGFKIASKKFADLQRMNVGVVNIMKMPQKKVKERIKDHNDRLVNDMLGYLKNNIKFKVSDQYIRLMSIRDSEKILKDFESNQDTEEMYSNMRKLIK